jgi:hypothetical protein
VGTVGGVKYAFLYFFHSSGMTDWNVPVYTLKRRILKNTTAL